MDEQILTIREVATYLKVHERTVYRLANKGEIPGFKVANVWRFRLCDIEQWIRAQMGAGTAGEEGGRQA